MNDLLISIVLPVRNQADHIGAILQEYGSALRSLSNPYELIVVANACRDNTAELCSIAAGKDSAIRVIENERGGWGLAVKLGLREAKGDLLCYTNCARTTGGELIRMLKYATVDPEVIIKANRKTRESWRRRLGSLLYNLECRALFDLPSWDINGTPKIFPRYFEKLLNLSREDDLIDAEFHAICRREGYPIIEIPIISTRRHGGKSTTTFRSALRMYWGAYRLWRAREGSTK